MYSADIIIKCLFVFNIVHNTDTSSPVCYLITCICMEYMWSTIDVLVTM